jgi:hypothetical protein
MKGDLDGIVQRVKTAKYNLEQARQLAKNAGDKDGAERLGRNAEEVKRTEEHFEGVKSDAHPK